MSGSLLVGLADILVSSLELTSSWHCLTQVVRAWCCSDGVNGPVFHSCGDFLQLAMNLNTYEVTVKSLDSVLKVQISII